MDLNGYLATKAKLVESSLETLLPQTGDLNQNLIEAMRYSLFVGGKRLRPALCMAGAEAVGAQAEQALPGAVALELIHTYSLIHDDLPCMDDDDFRRGRPSNHKVFGEGLALLAGDGLLTLGLGVLADAALEGRIEAGRAIRAQQFLVRAAGPHGMVAGQAVDLASEGRQVDEPVILFIHTHKTGALFEGAVAMGGILGGGEDLTVRTLAEFGRLIGLAFQIADDVLDVEGDPAVMGKPSGSDLARGKATYPALIGVEKCRDLAAEKVETALGCLSGFGKEAEPLRLIARAVINRKK